MDQWKAIEYAPGVAVRVALADGRWWCVARDVFDAMGYVPSYQMGDRFEGYLRQRGLLSLRRDDQGGLAACLDLEGLRLFVARSYKAVKVPFLAWVDNQLVAQLLTETAGA